MKLYVLLFVSFFAAFGLNLNVYAEQEKEFVKLVTMPKLSDTEARELFDAIKNELGAKLYKRKKVHSDNLSDLPERLKNVDTYIKQTGSRKKVIRFGVIKYVTRPSVMWVESVILDSDKVSYNDDCEDILKVINEETIADLAIMGELKEKRRSVLITLPKLDDVQKNDFLKSLKIEVAMLGYKEQDEHIAVVESMPNGITDVSNMVLAYDDKIRSVKFGVVSFLSLPSKLWLEGLEEDADSNLFYNSDLTAITQIINDKILPGVSAKSFSVKNLSKQQIQLSYASSEEAISSLKAQGMSAYYVNDTIPKEFSFSELPVILEMPSPKEEQTGLVGGGGASGLRNESSLTSATNMNTKTVTSQLNKLLVVYHPKYEAQFTNVAKTVNDFIDKAARQVLIEGMVLEISETGLKELGVEWELSHGDNFIAVTDGISDATSTDTSLAININKNFHKLNLAKDWGLKLKALIQSNKAEILSRPSVLTLDNRQATIRVGEDEPIAQTTTVDNGYSTSFSYLPTGILLNVRPRISADGDIISMAIDTTVSQKGEEVQVTDPTDSSKVLAQAPRISTRRVQTYATIANNTPFIIGGLISRDKKGRSSRIPFLSDLPFVGGAFDSEADEASRREVIIVLTPYVLPKQEVDRTTPKDDELFDTIGNELFRSSYRIKKSDLMDLSFLKDNSRVKELQTIAQKLADYGSPLAKESPYSSFVNGHFPGEQVIIQSMIYELVKKKGIHNQIGLDQLKFFKGHPTRGYEVSSLSPELEKIEHITPQEDLTWWEKSMTFMRLKDKRYVRDRFEDSNLSLAMTFSVNHDSIDMKTIFKEPVPKLEILNCVDHEEWEKKLNELNKEVFAGQTRNTILIKNNEDLIRLKVALVMKEIVAKNGGVEALELTRFDVGKQLLLPDLKKDQNHFIDAEVARYFVESNYYYPNLVDAVESSLSRLISSLQKLFLNTDYKEHGLTRDQLKNIGLAAPLDIYLQANRPALEADYVILPPSIDGLLDDRIWSNADPINGFVDADNRKIDELTEAKVAYDDWNLYLAVSCKEPLMDKLAVNSGGINQKIFSGDKFSLYIDANRDQSKLSWFEFNPLTGVECFYSEAGKIDSTKVCDVNTKITVTGDRWDIEAAIPWSSLDFDAPNRETKMGVLFYRSRKNGEQNLQFPLLNGSNHRVKFYGDLQFE